MKFVDAWWDTRNLGVACAEISFERSDSFDSFDDLSQQVEGYEYITAKIPAGRSDIITRLSHHGFVFNECLIELEHNLGQIELTGLASRFEKVIRRELVQAGCEEEVFSEIRKGLFSTDRVFLDPCFTPHIAAERYVNWLKDEIERGAELYQVFYKESRVGFFAYKESAPGVAYPFLASLYEDHFSSGLGVNVVVAEPLKLAKEKNCSRLDTFVSSNNPPILRIHEFLGFHTQDIFYVMTFHASTV